MSRGHWLAVALGLAAAAPAQAEVTIKLATLAPTGSAWHDLLRELGRRWEEASGGQVRLKVYAGGTQGSEGEAIRKLGIGQLQAAALTNVGLHDVVKEPQALTTPLLFRDEPEMACALERVRPRLEEVLLERGLVAVQWSTIGSLALYCDAARRTPAELAGARIFAAQGDPGVEAAWRLAGLTPVVLAATDIVPALQTGMIECLNNVPLYALATRTFVKAPWLIDLPMGFILGVTVVRRDTWERVPAELRPRLLAAARELGGRVDAEVRRLNADALEVMKRQGLQVVAVDPEAWRPALERSWAVLRGGVVPAPFFDEVLAARDACRKGLQGRGR
ncbi:MAG: TRAP transporter substrate-binding protein DctP [Anaeromyxobacter sp.]|nr:TRAP transporter substrate-binding protein DctP [Anaeromyxobacter sp.]MBL0278314.1 TRAP transporter substrate-binding protein DctP [Anaeromyxobacter sp.]